MRHQIYFVYLNPETQELWDPRTGDYLFRINSHPRLMLLIRILKRQLKWLILLLASSAPVWIK